MTLDGLGYVGTCFCGVCCVGIRGDDENCSDCVILRLLPAALLPSPRYVILPRNDSVIKTSCGCCSWGRIARGMLSTL
jgi:hypothetical protein